MNIKPLNNFVILKPIEKQEISNVLLVTKREDDKYIPNQGIVVDIPSNIPDVNIGDRIVYSEYKEVPIVINEEKFLFIKFEYILGVYNEAV